MYYWSGLSDDTLHNIHKILLVFFLKIFPTTYLVSVIY